MPKARPQNVPVLVRRMEFACEKEGFDRCWHSGSASISYLFAALSAAFPAGETFFIDSVRQWEDKIKDPALRAEIDDFCKQEGYHTYHHIQFNRINSQHGLAVEDCHRMCTWALAKMRRIYGPIHTLCVTMAWEHFTAGFAHQLLTNPRITQGADPKPMALWLWHVTEEIEHKATAYEVFQAVGGSYATRVAHWALALILFPSFLVFLQMYLLAKDGSIWNLRDVARGLWFTFGYRGFFSSQLPSLLSYFRPGFHPWEHDNSAAVANWRRFQPPSVSTVRSIGGSSVAGGNREPPAVHG
jgi:hypothetical protein